MAINENSETMIFFLLLKVVVIVVATCTQTTTIWHYGLNALIAGLLCMTLPETRDQPTLEVMETTDEGQNMELLAQDDEKKKKADDSHL